MPGVAASETGGAQTAVRARRGSDCGIGTSHSQTVLGKPAGEGESPVGEMTRDMAGSRVHRDTRNLDGMSGDHPVRLNTP